MDKLGAWPSTQSSLLLRIRKHDDQDAWSTFTTVYAPLIHGFCLKRGCQDADAADVTQNVLAQVAKSISAFEYDRAVGRFRGWLGQLTRQALSRQTKVTADGNSEFLEELQGDYDAEWIDHFHEQILNTALNRIRSEFSDDAWRTFDLLWIHDRSSQDVAAEMKQSAAWIYKTKFRVLERLKAEVHFLADDLPLIQP